MQVDALIPALDEEDAIGPVVEGLTALGLRRIVVVDNGSTDATAHRAQRAGAEVVSESRRGYGQACLTGLAYLGADPPDVVVFLDGDGADDPEDLPALLAPIRSGQAEFVVGSRVLGESENGALTPVQVFGNWLSCRLVKLAFGADFTDLGPFRAIRWSSLISLHMVDRDFGWTVEMQAKAARRGLKCQEIPVRSRRRLAGQSKISGTIRGSFKAGTKILYTIGKVALR